MSTVNARAQGSIDFLANHVMNERAGQLGKIPPTVLWKAQEVTAELAAVVADAAAETGGTSTQHRVQAGAMIDRPQLAAPRSGGGAATDTRQAGQLLASMAKALESANLSKLAFNAHSAAVRDAVRNAGSARLAMEYEAAQGKVAEALDQLEALSSKLEQSGQALEEAQQELLKAEAQLAAMDPEAPGYEAVRQHRDALRESVAAAMVDVTHGKQAVQAQQGHVLALQSKVDELLEKANVQKVAVRGETMKSDASNIARMLRLMTKLGELLFKAGETRSEAQRELLQVQADIRSKKLLKDAEKAEKDLAKAEAMNKAMGCVGKILGAVVTAVAFIGTPFTGGVSLALAGIGLTLMVADGIYQAVTGKSFMQEAMAPVMKLLQPVLQFVMDKVAGIMTGLGVDEQTARMAAMIVVSVVMAAAVVALAVTGAGSAVASAVSNVVGRLGSVLGKVMEKTIGKLIPEMLKKAVTQMARQASNGASRMFDAVSQRLGLSTDGVSKQIYAQNLGRIAAGVNFGKTVITSGLDVGVQVDNRKVAEIVASMKLTMSEQELINDMSANLLENLKKSFESSQHFFAYASQAIKQYADTGVAAARAVRGAHAA
ncbi:MULTISPECIES: type III secretion system translocon subunit SctE [unclassified Herbaspirillum]|uniref:type III secretion system translocon subunit SctE n=1 Tax=unclassified Herbaspirillum TaxID=2624150 RepID=UPI0011516FD2|nr:MULTISPECIES: type III secretion system translocon subunit SctE [unclassified Herbaspirillum]MBB5390580.1 invasin B [Herbaspirillum sp. SJZ102]TQK08932.1 type III secretion system translocon protein (YopB/IpaB/SipB family) [Herbaspirillum sp. SJZ130]TQK14381.1 type III secretion system translocon protein (YopB/IpaB/SipB family) [Herbaspirillum sp. SJZ106]